MRAARALFKMPQMPHHHCPVGRVTPPRRGVLRQPDFFAITHNYRQVCRGRIVASRAVYPSGCSVGLTAAGGIYAAPTNDPLCSCNRKIAGGAYPAPTARWFFTHSTDTHTPTRSKCAAGCWARPPPSCAGGGYSRPQFLRRRSSFCPRRPPKFSRAPAPWTGCG